MFAKLKKKVIEENGGRGMEGGERSPGASAVRSSGSLATVHSPVSKDAPSGGGWGDLRAAHSTERLAVSSTSSAEESGKHDSGLSREDLMALLTKRTEQCKKMESSISDLAALIKDKNKHIDQLETQAKQHEEVSNQRLSEQKSEFEAYRDKLIAGYQEDKLALDKLLIAQTELETCRNELDTKSQVLSTAQTRLQQLETDFTQTKEKADTLERECERLKEDNKERAELVMSLTKEKAVFQKRLDQLNTEMTEKQNHMAELNCQLSELDSNYRALEHSSEQQKNKASQQTAKLLQEKQDHIELLQERVVTLEQRLQGQSLSGDDRVVALQAERENLERKLSETRQQLTEVKSSWSDKISHLEAQISHLNTKIVEDSEELANSSRAANTMRDNFHKQIEDLRRQLEDAEKRALENYELANSKNVRHDFQIRELESEVSHAKLTCVDLETKLRGKITSLEVQLSELESARQAERDDLKWQLEQVKRQNEEATERELRQEQMIRTTEEQCLKLETEQTARQEEVFKLRAELDSRDLTSSDQGQLVKELEERVSELREELTINRTELTTTRRQFNQSDQEKGELMVRNAQLFQQLTSIQQQLSQQRVDTEGQLSDREQTVHSQQQSIEQLNDTVATLQKQVQELESANAALGSTGDLESTIRDLQEQLADKTRTLKKQEQTVKDLRQTLQRELKVQALPNDETSDDNAPSPSTSRKFPSHPVQRQAATTNSLQGQSFNHALSSSDTQTPSGASSSLTTAAVKPMTLTSLMQVSNERGLVVRRDLEQDVNFQYLKHVVLKFMLSREAEAVQLIKAVAVLLNFNHQEQALIKQTLEWKMSWFGSRPSLGKGQKAKIIPPSY